METNAVCFHCGAPMVSGIDKPGVERDHFGQLIWLHSRCVQKYLFEHHGKIVRPVPNLDTYDDGEDPNW